MSIACMNWAFELGIPPRETLVLLALADWAGKGKHPHPDQHIVWPSFKKISTRTRHSPATVKRAIKNLVEWGLITAERREGFDKRNASNLYILHIEREAPEDVINAACIRLTQGGEEEEETSIVTKTCESSDSPLYQSDTSPPLCQPEGEPCITLTQANKKPNTKPITPHKPLIVIGYIMLSLASCTPAALVGCLLAMVRTTPEHDVSFIERRATILDLDDMVTDDAMR